MINNNLDITTNEIIKENSQMIPNSHPTSIRCEQKIIKQGDTKYIIQNNYMTLTNKQYLHFFKNLSNQLTQMNEYQTQNKSIQEVIFSKGIELLIEQYGGNPSYNLTVAEVAKDLKMGENLANQVFRRPDFPAINIGKTKTVNIIAYFFWKMSHKEELEVMSNEENK